MLVRFVSLTTPYESNIVLDNVNCYRSALRQELCSSRRVCRVVRSALVVVCLDGAIERLIKQRTWHLLDVSLRGKTCRAAL